MRETPIDDYDKVLDQPHWIQSLKVLDNRAVCDRCGDIQPRHCGPALIDKWNAYHFSRSCEMADRQSITDTLLTISNMDAYLVPANTNPNPVFMRDFYRQKLVDAINYAKSGLLKVKE